MGTMTKVFWFLSTSKHRKKTNLYSKKIGTNFLLLKFQHSVLISLNTGAKLTETS